MKKIMISVLMAAVFALPVYAADKVDLKTEKDKFSYSIGVNIGSNLKRQGIDADLDLLLRGINDALKGGAFLMSEKEQRDVMTAFQKKQKKKMDIKRKKDGAENRAKGEKFLAENKKKPGVVTLPSGLQYKVLTKGKGPKPVGTDKVRTHYKGTLIGGTEFDSSYSRGKPASFMVRGVIKGWTEALQLMNVGSKWELYIPPDLAYGDRGAGGRIGPGETLIFEIELLDIVEK